MGKHVYIHCTVCGRKSEEYIPYRYGDKDDSNQEVFVAGCSKCQRQSETYETTRSASPSGFAVGCLESIGGLVFLAFLVSCCCGGLGGKS